MFKIGDDDKYGIIFFGIISIITFIVVSLNLIPNCIVGITSILCIVSFLIFLKVLFRNIKISYIFELVITLILVFLITLVLGKWNDVNLEYIIVLVFSIVILYCILKTSKPFINFFILILCISPFILVKSLIIKINNNCDSMLVFIIYMLTIRFLYPIICKVVNAKFFRALNKDDELREFYKLANALISTLLLFQYSNDISKYDKRTVLLLIIYLIFDIKWETFINKNEEK